MKYRRRKTLHPYNIFYLFNDFLISSQDNPYTQYQEHDKNQSGAEITGFGSSSLLKCSFFEVCKTFDYFFGIIKRSDMKKFPMKCLCDRLKSCGIELGNHSLSSLRFINRISSDILSFRHRSSWWSSQTYCHNKNTLFFVRLLETFGDVDCFITTIRDEQQNLPSLFFFGIETVESYLQGLHEIRSTDADIVFVDTLQKGEEEIRISGQRTNSDCFTSKYPQSPPISFAFAYKLS